LGTDESPLLIHSDISKVQFSMFSALLVTFKGSFTRIPVAQVLIVIC
jgi:hypothetical protein